MSAAPTDLPAGMTDWIAATGGGELTRLERHVARREAWVVDVTRPDGSVLAGVARLLGELLAGDEGAIEADQRAVKALPLNQEGQERAPDFAIAPPTMPVAQPAPVGDA